MFGTSGVRGPVGETVTAELALSVGRAVGTSADRVVLGRDARDSGRMLMDALAAGLQETGTDVIALGRAATPTIARGVGDRDADAGIAITASHNPPADNGIKLWSPSGQAFTPDEQETIVRRIERDSYALSGWDEQGVRRQWTDATAAHRKSIVDVGADAADAAGVDLGTLSIVVDVGNGMGGITADALYELGATVETLNAQPDGRFPGRPSEPTAETCRTLRRCVDRLSADLGIAHDGDADRMMAVDDEGTFVPGDVLLAVFGREIASAGDRVAAPINTSLAVDDALAEIGASIVHTKVGDGFVADRTTDDDVVFGGEPSGAWIFPEETLCPDGPLAAVKLAVLAAEQPLSDRVSVIDRYPIRREAIETDHKSAVMKRVAERLRAENDSVDDLDGLRVSREQGWFLVRASGTQPIVRLTAEARSASVADALRSEARSIVEGAIDEVES